MLDSIRALSQIMAPPVRESLLSVPWERSAVESGFDLPPDYREFIDLYGQGAVRGELDIHMPWISGPWLGGEGGFSYLVEYMNILWDPESFRRLRTQSPGAYPYPLFPEEGGLLAWAHNGNADYCFWLTDKGDPAHWPVIVWDRAAWRRYDCGMAELLVRLLAGRDAELNRILSAAEGTRLWVDEMS